MPAGVERRRIAFADAIEQPRAEYFLRGTGQSLIAAAPATARRARIVNPASGSVYAIDPDIPADRQRLAGQPGLAHPGRARHDNPRRTKPDRRRDPAQLLVPAGERPWPLHGLRLVLASSGREHERA